MQDFKDEVLSHFNEPVLIGLDVVRCIGYGEDTMDRYIIVQFPNPNPRIVWCTGVGGYIFLDRLKGQNHVKSTEGEDWDDLFRLDQWLALNGAPKAETPVIKEQYALFLDDVRDPPDANPYGLAWVSCTVLR